MLRLSCIIPPLRQCCKTLRELDLVITDPYSTVIGPDEVYRKPVSLRALKSLVLRRNSIDFLRYIKARHLKELVFEIPAALIPSNLLAFLIRSPSAAIHLRRLDFRYRDNDAETEILLQCFELTSNVEELRVVTASRADDVGKLFGDLECCEDEAPLLPRLKSVNLPRRSQSDEFRAFVRSRAIARVICGTEVTAMQIGEYFWPFF